MNLRRSSFQSVPALLNALGENVVLGLIGLRFALMLAALAMAIVSKADPHQFSFFMLLAVVSVWSGFVWRLKKLHTQWAPGLRELLTDIAWVGIFVFLHGGTANPFIYYYLVITALAAMILKRAVAWYLCGLCAGLYTLLLGNDVTAHFDHLSDGYKSHLIGMWFNYVGSSVILCFFLTRLVRLTRKQQRNIDKIREQNLKNEQVIGLATVSASTVHQLATPLATLLLLTEELKLRKLDTESKSDLNVMLDQIQACRRTMDELSSLAQRTHESYRENIDTLMDAVQDQFVLDAEMKMPNIQNTLSEIVWIECNPLLKYALINLINNAVSSSSFPAEIIIRADEKSVFIDIENNSSHSKEDIEKRWGKPTQSTKEEGLGIGSFLANTTIEQQGGSVHFQVVEDPALAWNKVKVRIQFPKMSPP